MRQREAQLGTTKDTPIETLQFMLESPTNANQIEACRSVLSKIPTTHCTEVVKATKGCWLERGKSWTDAIFLHTGTATLSFCIHEL